MAGMGPARAISSTTVRSNSRWLNDDSEPLRPHLRPRHGRLFPSRPRHAHARRGSGPPRARRPRQVPGDRGRSTPLRDRRPFRVRGVTYGSFLPRADGVPFPVRETCRADLTAIADAGLNVLRTYTVPPPEILELAAETGLRVLVGLQYHDWRMLPETRFSGKLED